MLRRHFASMGYATPAQFTLSEWQYFKEATRMLVRLLVKVMGATIYGPERWHFEFGTQILNLEGQVAVTDPLAGEFPRSGGPGYTVIKQGRGGTAVWHTAVTEAALRKQGLLEE